MRPRRFWERVPIESTIDLHRGVVNLARAAGLLCLVMIASGLIGLGLIMAASTPVPALPQAVPLSQIITRLTGGICWFEFAYNSVTPSTPLAWGWRLYSISDVYLERVRWHPVIAVTSVLAATSVMSITLLGLPDTRRQAKIRTALIGRAALHSFAPIGWIVPLWILLQIVEDVARLNALRTAAGASVWYALSGIGAQALILDLLPTSNLVFRLPTALGGPVVCLVMAWQFVYWGSVIRSWRMKRDLPVRVVIGVILGLLTAIFLLPAYVARAFA